MKWESEPHGKQDKHDDKPMRTDWDVYLLKAWKVAEQKTTNTKISCLLFVYASVGILSLFLSLCLCVCVCIDTEIVGVSHKIETLECWVMTLGVLLFSIQSFVHLWKVRISLKGSPHEPTG